MAAPLFVATELARYEDGRTSPMLLFPVREKVSFDEFERPVIVTVPPFFETAAAESIVTNSALPAWMIVRTFVATPDAEKFAVVCLAVRPVLSEALQETVSFPLPLTLLGFTHEESYAIVFLG
jgi:hypothetical protein